MHSLFALVRARALVTFIALTAAHAAHAADAVLESSALRLELFAAPYSYSVIEKATGAVLVAESQVTFTAGTANVASGAQVTTQTATTLEATLALAGTGDTARVRFTFTSPEVLKVELGYDGGTPTNIKEQFLDQGEHVYGLWGLPSAATGSNIDTRGADRHIMGVGNMPGSNWANVRAPFYVTDRKYAVWTDSEARGHYTIAVNGQTGFHFDAPALTYYVIYGPSYKEIFARYNALAGGSFMPPLYAFGVFWWRDDHTQDHAANGVSSMQDLVLKDADNLQALQLPASAMWIDRPVGSQQGGGLVGWGNFDFNPAANGFADPAGMIENLRNRGMKLFVWIANRTNNSMLTDPQLGPYRFTTGCRTNCTSTPAVDIRDPIPYARFQERLDSFTNLGVAGYKIDRGEEGELPDALMNQFTPLVHRMSYEQLFRHYGTEAYQFARNNYDRSRKYASTWNGDTQTSFLGLTVSVKMATRAGAINFPMYGSDTGGYTGGAPTKEVFARWLAFSAHTSIMEILLGPNRTIWNNYNTGANANPPLLTDIARKFTQEHHDMIPYTRSLLHRATQNGWPVHQMMPLAFPDDVSPGFHDMWDQYMFGDALLVAPVVTAGATSRPVYLPEGEWIDYNDKTTRYTGPLTITAAAPLDVIPRYVKAGSIVPRGDILKANNNWTPNWAPYLQVEFYPAQDVASAFDYYTGSGVVPITGTRTADAVSLQFGNLQHPGTVEVRDLERFGSVTRNGQKLEHGVDYEYDGAQRTLTFAFAGATSAQIGLGPAVEAGPNASVVRGTPFDATGSVFEIGASSLAAVVDYGDGSGQQQMPVVGGAFTLSHTFADVGVFTVQVTATDDAGRTGSDTLLVTSVYPSSGVPGDVNGDAVVSCADLTAATASMGKRTGQPGFFPTADIDRNGIVDIRDVAAISRLLAVGTPC